MNTHISSEYNKSHPCAKVKRLGVITNCNWALILLKTRKVIIMPLSIVFVGTPPLWDVFRAALESTYTLHHMTQEGAYMQTLVTEQPILVVVDGTRDDWARWTSVPKSSPATRRIPIVLLSDDPHQREQAPKQGADAVVSSVEADPLTLVQTYAHLPDMALQEQLDHACEEDLPPLAQQGVERFNAGEYYKQHDLLEELWMHTPGPQRDLYQGILQVGVAYYQITRGNDRGARKMLQRALQWLRKLPDACQGVDVADLRQNAQTVLDLLSQPEFRIENFDSQNLRPVLYTTKYKKGHDIKQD
jgi:predicted metal-dependent hydrolase